MMMQRQDSFPLLMMMVAQELTLLVSWHQKESFHFAAAVAAVGASVVEPKPIPAPPAAPTPGA